MGEIIRERKLSLRLLSPDYSMESFSYFSSFEFLSTLCETSFFTQSRKVRKETTKKKAKKSTLFLLMRNFGLKLPIFERRAGAKLGLYEIADALRLGRK